jgi:E3 ubiquitin-protein ligase RFWD2
MQNRIMGHLSDLEDVYFSKADISQFSRDLYNFSRFSKLKTTAVLHYADNFFNYASSIVSSIEFDKDDEYFAIAGVTKKIRIFEFKEVVRDYTSFRNASFVRDSDHEVV